MTITKELSFTLTIVSDREYMPKEVRAAAARIRVCDNLADQLGASAIALAVTVPSSGVTRPLRAAARLVELAHDLAGPVLPRGAEIPGEGYHEINVTLGTLDYVMDLLNIAADEAREPLDP